MAINIDFTAESIVSNYCLGHIAEHNAQSLSITVPTALSTDERTDHYRVRFATNGKVYETASMTTTPLSIPLWYQLTQAPRLSLQVIAFDEDGDFVGKSAKLSGFYFESSVSDSHEALDSSYTSIDSEIYDLDARLTICEVEIDDLTDALDEKQNKIDADHKLSYSLISGTPTIPTVPTNVSAFTNDAGYLTSHQDISGKADTYYVDTQLLTKADKSNTYTKTETNSAISGHHDVSKQDKLTAGDNISIDEDGVISATGGGGGASSWNDITDKPTTVSGYGITDAYTKSEVDAKTHLEIAESDSVSKYSGEEVNTYDSEGRYITYNNNRVAKSSYASGIFYGTYYTTMGKVFTIRIDSAKNILVSENVSFVSTNLVKTTASTSNKIITESDTTGFATKESVNGKQPLLPDGTSEGQVLTWNGTAWANADAPSGGGATDYSTTEQMTGQKWIDGRDIYCVTNLVDINGGRFKSNGVNLLGVTEVLWCDGFIINSNIRYKIPHYQSSSFFISAYAVKGSAGNANYSFDKAGSWTGSIYLTVYYLKD